VSLGLFRLPITQADPSAVVQGVLSLGGLSAVYPLAALRALRTVSLIMAGYGKVSGYFIRVVIP